MLRHGSCEPFLRWAGGKRQLREQLTQALPPDIHNSTYHEPFLGAATIFFASCPFTAKLSDANAALIETFRHVRDEPDTIYQYLRAHIRQHSKAYYYETRTAYNNTRPSISRSAKFVYLNMAGFNGIFRVNAAGQYNVPIGDKTSLRHLHRGYLIELSNALQRAEISHATYKTSVGNQGRGDFIYLDPPYPSLSATAYFAHYTSERFSDEDQRELSDRVIQVDRAGAKVLISNANTPLIRKLYKNFKIQKVPVRRYVTCNSVRHTVKELIITNY